MVQLESTLLFEVEAEAMETFYSRRMKGLPEKFRNHSQVLLGAVDDKRWVLLSTSPRITSSVSLQRSFLPLSAILEEWGFGLDCCADWRCRCSCFLPFPYAPTGIKKQ